MLWEKSFWTCMGANVAKSVRNSHTCQVFVNPYQTIPKHHHVPIPAVGPPFSRLIIDIMGASRPTSSEHQYLLTILYPVTRYPEAVLLRNIRAWAVIKTLFELFTKFGLPREVQSDQGSNYISYVFQQAVWQLGVAHIRSSAYHPDSQGAWKKFHDTLNTKYCLEHSWDCDRGVPFLLFAMQEVLQENLGFSPNELVFCYRIRVPVKLIKEAWSCESHESPSFLQYVQGF